MSYDGLTDPLGQSQILPYLSGLSDHKTRLFVVSCEKTALFIRNKEAVERVLTEHAIVWMHVPYTKGLPVLSPLLNLLRIRQKVLMLHQKHQFRIVHCRSYLPALIGAILKRKGVRFLFDMRGFWADERVDGSLWNLSNLLHKLIYIYFKYKELDFLTSADHIVSLTHAAKAEISSWNGCAGLADRISVVPCCVDTKLFDPTKLVEPKLRAARSSLKITDGDDVIVYLGSVGTWYMLDEMLAFFVRVLRKRESSLFLFITQDEHAYIRIRAQARAFGIPHDRVVITSAQRHEVPLYLSLARFGIFFIKPSYSKIASSPTKQGEMMALGLPIICNSGIGDTDRIIRRFDSGILVETFDDYTYDRVVEMMNTGSFVGDAITAGARDYFSLEAGIERYRRIYESLLESYSAESADDRPHPS